MILPRLRAPSVSPLLWLKLAVVAGVLYLSATFAPRASLFSLIPFAGIGVALVLIRKPELGLLALLVSALVVPFSIGTGTQTQLHLAFLLIPLMVAVWVAEMVRKKSVRLVPSSVNAPLLLFALSATLSFLAGNLPWNYFASTASLSAQLGGLAVFVFSVAVFLLVANQVQDLRWLKILLWLFLALGSIYIIGRIVPGLGRLSGLFPTGATGSVFWIWLVALAAGQALFNDDIPISARAATFALALATLAVGILQGFSWASGWLPPLIALMLLVWLRAPRAGLLLLVPLGIVFAMNYTHIRDSVLTTGDNLYSWETRLAAWQIVFEIVKANPILGLGPANYYFAVQLLPIMGYYVQFNSHNNYVDIIAQTGGLGLGLFLWCMLAIGRVGWSLRARVEDGFARGYVNGCLAGLAGTLAAGMLGDWFLPFVYNIGIAGFRASMLAWLFLGGLVALEQAVSHSLLTNPLLLTTPEY